MKITMIKADVFLGSVLASVFLVACGSIPRDSSIHNEPMLEQKALCPEQQDTGYSSQQDPDLDGGISGTGHKNIDCKKLHQ